MAGGELPAWDRFSSEEDNWPPEFWGRLEAYLDPAVRAATSPWHQLPPEIVTRVVESLGRDLASGAGDARYGHLRRRTHLDVGLRLVTASL